MTLESKLDIRSGGQSDRKAYSSLAYDARRVLNYLIPFFERYDPHRDARQVLDDPAVSATGISYAETASYLYESYVANKLLWRFAQLADTTDRPISLFGIIAEAVGTLAGVVPGTIVNLNEETIELSLKLPFFINLAVKGKQHKGKIIRLLGIEAVTYAAPALGDAIDAGTNLYMGTAHAVIREYAKQRILEDKVSMTASVITVAPVSPTSTNDIV